MTWYRYRGYIVDEAYHQHFWTVDDWHITAKHELYPTIKDKLRMSTVHKRIAHDRLKRETRRKLFNQIDDTLRRNPS